MKSQMTCNKERDSGEIQLQPWRSATEAERLGMTLASEKSRSAWQHFKKNKEVLKQS